MKTSEIIAAVENGAKWQIETPLFGWSKPSTDYSVKAIINYLSNGIPVRLTPQKKTVPLGSEDWEGTWWVKGPKWEGRWMAIGIDNTSVRLGHSGSSYTYGNMSTGEFLRSRDGKTWEPCHKEVEE